MPSCTIWSGWSRGPTVTVLENGPAAARFNKCMEIDVADGAAFHHVRAQGRDHERRAVTHMFARLGTESTYKSFSLTANGMLTRNEHVVELTGDDAIAHVAGARHGRRGQRALPPRRHGLRHP
jgi:Fe-S cluster assembly protein SufD